MFSAKKVCLISYLSSLSFGLSVACSSANVAASQTVEAELVDDYPVYQQAQDLNYGGVLFEYHQGRIFEALSALSVAKLRGGIEGHDQHPDLVEGGLMLAYGMVDDAKAVFESLLKKQISFNDRNQAWFYLAKVFFLLEADPSAQDSIENIQQVNLQENNSELFFELQYMKGQMTLRDSRLSSEDKTLKLSRLLEYFPVENIWGQYLQYNLAISLVSLDKGEASESVQALTKLADVLKEYDDSERANLREQCLLSLGQLYLQKGDNHSAFDILKEIKKDGLLSDQALFAYAVAAANLSEHGLALQALTVLKDRPEFTPWSQQVPYALAYLYEQMSEPELALQSYRVAVTHYHSLQTDIKAKQSSIEEERLLAAIDLPWSIGDENLVNDAYGKIKVMPSDYSFSHLLANESFQRQLSDLHELYKLENSLKRWATQLDSFETMMVTRIALRNEKIKNTNLAIEEQNAELWEAQRLKFKQALDHASKNEDLRFFMNEEQIQYTNRIAKAVETLDFIPTDHRKRQRYEDRLNRVKAYFEWWLSESYSENHWRAMKEMRALDRQMHKFNEHQAKIVGAMATDGGNQLLADRVKAGRNRLAEIQAELSLSLKEVRENLLALVRQDYDQQIAEVQIYLQASREALARLSDQLYHTLQRRDSEAKESSQ